MTFYLVRNDITKMQVDAIVNAANEHLKHGGGVARAIAVAAGWKDMERASNKIGFCPTGSAVITPGFNLPARYVIHTVGPIWHGGENHEAELLASAYTSSLELARAQGLKSVAFPLISAGIYGYPLDEALAIANRSIKAFLAENEMDVFLVLYNSRATLLGKQLQSDLQEYIDSRYVAEHYDPRREDARRRFAEEVPRDVAPKGSAAHEVGALFGLSGEEAPGPEALVSYLDAPCAQPQGAISAPPCSKKDRKAASETAARSAGGKDDLGAWLKNIDSSFSDTLLRLIDLKGLSDAQAYKRANVSRQHFSKIKNAPDYQPKKATVLAFAVALRLSLEETQDLLRRAGYTLSDSSKADIIFSYFISHNVYDIYRINEALFEYDQPLLGQIG